MKKMLIINGPNLNMLGQREPEVYGKETLEDLIQFTEAKLKAQVMLDWYQSNLEGELVTRIQKACSEDYDALIINPGAMLTPVLPFMTL